MKPEKNVAAKLHNLETEVRYLAHLLGVKGDWRAFTPEFLTNIGRASSLQIYALAQMLEYAETLRECGDIASINQFVTASQGAINRIYATANF